MTPHSTFVRSLPLLGWKLLATAKGADDVRKIDVQRPDTEVAVILGVDTHLDFHVAVALDHLGREAWGESSVPTNVEGYERLLRWAEGFGPVRCAGVEKAPAELRGRARSVHLRARGIEVLEVERPEHRRRSLRRNLEKSDPSDAYSAARAGNRPEKPRACPRAQTALWR